MFMNPDMINAYARERYSKSDRVPKEWIEYYTNQEHYLGREIIINGEIKNDRYGRFRYTKVKYTSNKKLHYEEEFKRAIKAVNILIDIYRIETFEHWITNVTENEIFIYKSIGERQMSFTIKGFIQLRHDHEMETVEMIKIQLMDKVERFPYFMLILDARRSLDENKYYLAVIYGITALESMIKTYVSFYCQLNHLSRNVEKELNRSPLSVLVTIILRIMVKSKKLTNELIGKIEKGIRIRNEVIHQTKFNISEEQASNIIKDVEEMTKILLGDIDSYYASNETKV